MAKSEEKSEEKVGGKRRAEPEKKRDTGSTVRSVRSATATAIWVLAVLAAVVLAAGALVIVLDFNAKNGVVKFFRETADSINFLGVLKDFEPGKGESAHDALVKEVLVNWGICAVVYLVLGKLLERVIRP